MNAPAPGPALSRPAIAAPLWLLAELTYRCPLHCPFCSNPVDYTQHDRELTTEQWCDVFTQARALGAVQLGLSGGEPLMRKDLETLVAHAHKLGFYVNLVTSGVDLNALVGREFRVGSVRLRGLRLCEPCSYLAKISFPATLRGLVHQGGLRAKIVSEGVIRIGDAVSAA